MKTSHFVDYVRIRVKAGDGGNGSISFRREKYVPEGGPAGGRGGGGGSVYLEGSTSMVTLLDFKSRTSIEAKRGDDGANFNKAGKSGLDVVLKVPLGTCVLDAETGEEIGEVTEAGQRLLVAKGGMGGRGNESFATSTNRTPRTAEKGQPGGDRSLILELKALADVGLVGLPNAGKSTLLGGLTQATPKIASYPFTTLHPNLGVMMDDSMSRTLTLADIPGLIEGAHSGAGLGDRFLRHIERTRVLVHLVSPLEGVPDPVDAKGRAKLAEDLIYGYELVRQELEQYGRALAEKPTIVCLNKSDLLSATTVRSMQRAFKKKGVTLLAISAQSGVRLDALRKRILEEIEALEAKEREPALRESWENAEADPWAEPEGDGAPEAGKESGA